MKKPIWTLEGVGTADEVLDEVIEEFKENGVEGIESAQAITKYLDRLPKERLKYIWDREPDVAAELICDYLGATAAVEFGKWHERQINQQVWEKSKQGMLSQIKEKEERLQGSFKQIYTAGEERTALKEHIADLEMEIVRLKAKLYDTYEAQHKPTDAQKERGILKNE